MTDKNKDNESNEIKNDQQNNSEIEEREKEITNDKEGISSMNKEEELEINNPIDEDNEPQSMDIDTESNNEKKEVDKLFNDIQNIWQQPEINNFNNFTSSMTQNTNKDKINMSIQEKKSHDFSFNSNNKYGSQFYTPNTSYNRNISYPPKNNTQSNLSIPNRYDDTRNYSHNNRGIIFPPQNNNFGSHNYNQNNPTNYYSQNHNPSSSLSSWPYPQQPNNFGFNQQNNMDFFQQPNNFGFNQQNNMRNFQQSNNFGFNRQLRDQGNNFGFNYQDNNFKNYQYPINSYSKSHDSFRSINDRKRRKSIRDNILNSSRRYNRSYNSSSRRTNWKDTNYNRNKSTITHSAICDVCGMKPIKGDRYKSLVQNDYDLCKDCWMNCQDKSNYQLIKDFKNIDTSVQNGAVVLEINSSGTINPQESKFLESFFNKVLNKESQDKKSVDKENPTNDDKIQKNKDNNSDKFKINKEKDIDELDLKVESLDDLIKISELYSKGDFITKNYSINVKGIYDMVPALKELHNLVGLEKVKKKVLDQIIFFSQDLHNEYKFIESEDKEKKSNNNPLLQILSLSNKPANTSEEFNKYESCLKNDDNLDMLHTVIEGPPGVGKTIFGKILARIYLSLGITHKDKFKIVRRTDLVGEYLGHTAMKTQKAIDEALGGVLFIDEAYQLGNGSERKIDSYSKECIDTLNQNLSEKKGQFICIIAGYKKELEENFFSVNPGLKRRFSFKYTIDSYTWEELTSILVHKIPKMKWQIEEGTEEKLFKTEFLKEKMDQFPHYGGDIETLLLNVKIEHGKRVFGKRIEHHKKINYEDIENGYNRFLENRKIEKETLPFGMFI